MIEVEAVDEKNDSIHDLKRGKKKPNPLGSWGQQDARSCWDALIIIMVKLSPKSIAKLLLPMRAGRS